MKRHVGLNIEAAKEIKQHPIDGDLEQLLAETCEKRDSLQLHFSVIKVSEVNLKTPLKPQEKGSTTKSWTIIRIMLILCICLGTFVEN